MGLAKTEPQPDALMAHLELFYFDQPDPRGTSLVLQEQSVEEISSSGGKLLHPGGAEASAPWTEPRGAAPPEAETSFSCRQHAVEEEEEEEEEEVEGADVRSMETSPKTGRLSQSSSGELYEEEEVEEVEDIPELYLLSDDDLSDGPGKSVDYGFIIAVTCLVTGISLVAISYTVPRDVRATPESVSAREMEQLERERARVGAHLDRCVIAGLCLLTLGGVLLSTLLMVSLWKGEMMRRKAFAYSKHAANLYGSMGLRVGSSPTLDSCSHRPADEALEELS